MRDQHLLSSFRIPCFTLRFTPLRLSSSFYLVTSGPASHPLTWRSPYTGQSAGSRQPFVTVNGS
jgi:hypothetical protein